MNQTRLSPFVFTRFPDSLSSIVICGSCERRSHFTPIAFISPSSPSSKSSDSSPPLLFNVVFTSCRSNSALAPFCTLFLGQYIAFPTPFFTRLAAPRCTTSPTLFSAGTPFLKQCFHTICLGDSSILRRNSATTSSYNASLSRPLPRTY